MLNWEGLKEQAKLLGLPLNKQRAIVREYAQTIVLKAIYQGDYGRKLFFKGGTALRFAYGLGRFSEDLDFNARDLSAGEFKEISKDCIGALEKEGLKCQISQKERKTILVGWIKLTNILQNYKISTIKDEKLMVKLEVNSPEWQLNSESEVIDRYGYLFTVLLMNKGALLAEKTDAFLRRCRGRDVYDLIFMLQKKFPIDNKVFAAKGWEVQPQRAILDFLEEIKPQELVRLAKQIEPFLLNENEIDFVINAKTYIKAMLK